MKSKSVKTKKLPKRNKNLPKLDKLYLSDNETLSMIKRYTFDSRNSQKIIEDTQIAIDELNILQEQKEYEEMNYYAIYRRLAKYSTMQIFIILIKALKTLIVIKEQEN